MNICRVWYPWFAKLKKYAKKASLPATYFSKTASLYRKNLKPHMREFRIDAFACLYPLASSSENYAGADGRFYDEADLGFKAD